MAFDRNRAVFDVICPKAADLAKREGYVFVAGELYTEVCEIVSGIPRTVNLKNTASKVWRALGLVS